MCYCKKLNSFPFAPCHWRRQLGLGGNRLLGQEVSNDAAQHLACRHAELSCGGFQLQSLPPGKKKGKFHNFLVLTSHIH